MLLEFQSSCRTTFSFGWSIITCVIMQKKSNHDNFHYLDCNKQAESVLAVLYTLISLSASVHSPKLHPSKRFLDSLKRLVMSKNNEKDYFKVTQWWGKRLIL